MTGSERCAPAGVLLAVLLTAVPLNLSMLHLGVRGSPGTTQGKVSSSSELPAPAVLHLHLGDLAMPVPPGPDPARTHMIAPGETLWAISQAAGVTVAALASANHISTGSTLHPGQVLVVPERETGAPASSTAAQQHHPTTHTVAPGDTLWDIARNSDVSVAALAAANHLSPGAVLRPGQVLDIPARGTPDPASSNTRWIAARAGGGARSVTDASGAASTRAAGAPAQTVAQRLQLLWPSSGVVTSRFGWRTHPIFGTREFHTGMDIATRWGSPVLAARSGIVRYAGWMAGYGRLIVVDHGGGLQTLYSHLSAVLVGSGQKVTKGEIIGRVGSTGWSTGPHLFFEIRHNGVPQDPARYLY